MGWSPALWSIGFQILGGPSDGDGASGGAGSSAPLWAQAPLLLPTGGSPRERAVALLRAGRLWAAKKAYAAFSPLRRVLNPPLWGVIFGLLVGCTPVGQYVLPPPSHAAAAAAPLAPLPPELALFAVAGKASMDVITLLGSAALPIGVVVLAASFGMALKDGSRGDGGAGGRQQGQGPPGGLGHFLAFVFPVLFFGAEAGGRGGRAAGAAGAGGRAAGASGLPGRGAGAPSTNGSGSASTSLQLAVPSPSGAAAGSSAAFPPPSSPASAAPSAVLPGKAEAVIALARFVVVPALTLAAVLLLRSWGLLSGSALDRNVLLVLLVQSAMPSAQNLVLLLNLKPGGRAEAGALAASLVRQYVVAALPVAFWLSVFSKVVVAGTAGPGAAGAVLAAGGAAAAAAAAGVAPPLYL